MEPIAEVKKAVDDLNKGFEEFKKVNDRKLADLEKKGSADVLDEDQLKRINAFLDSAEDIKAKAEGAAKLTEERHAEIVKKQDALKAEYKERFDAVETAIKRSPKLSGSDDEGSAKLKEAKSMFADFARKAPHDMEPEVRKRLIEAKVLSVSNDTAAGFLAPAEYFMEMIKGVILMSPLRSLARVQSTSRTSVSVPKRTGTFAALWTAERGTRSETEGLTYGLEEIPTHEMYALVDITDQMVEDSMFDIESELDMEFREQFAVAEGAAFITGDGAGKPEGILDNAAVAETNSGSAATIADADGQANGLITLQHAIKTEYARNAAWILNRQTVGVVRALKDGDKNYIWAAGAAVGNPNTILGDPYVEMPDMPAQAAGAYPIAYGDFRRAYRIVDRVSLSILRDPYTQATSGNIRFIARRRVGGQVVLVEAIRKLKCAA